MLNIFRPHTMVRRVEDIDCRALMARGLRGVMIDLDNTLAPWRVPHVAPVVTAWLDCLRQSGLRACMVTNAANADRVSPIATHLGIPWVIRARKPFGGGFRQGMRLLDTAPAETAMVGDMLLTDIFGGNRLGLYTILVDPMCAREAFIARILHRPFEHLVGRLPKLANR